MAVLERGYLLGDPDDGVQRRDHHAESEPDAGGGPGRGRAAWGQARAGGAGRPRPLHGSAAEAEFRWVHKWWACCHTWKDGNEIINSHKVTIDQQGEKLTISATTGTGTGTGTSFPAEGEGREDHFWRR